MRRMAHLCLVLAALFVVNCSNHTASTSDTPAGTAEADGFRGVRWDTPLEEMKSELVLVGNDDGRDIQWYKKENEELFLGAASLESIHYVFHEGLFKSCSISFSPNTGMPKSWAFFSLLPAFSPAKR